MARGNLGEFRVTGTAELQKVLRTIGARMPKAAGEALFKEGKAIMRVSKERVPVDTGRLKRSGRVLPPTHTARGAKVWLGYSAPHAVEVHEGTGPLAGSAPYRPPASALRGWAQRKFGTSRAAYGVAKNIAETGTKPTKFLEEPLREAMPGMPHRLAVQLRAALRDITRTAGGRSRLAKQLTKGRVRRRTIFGR